MRKKVTITKRLVAFLLVLCLVLSGAYANGLFGHGILGNAMTAKADGDSTGDSGDGTDDTEYPEVITQNGKTYYRYPLYNFGEIESKKFYRMNKTYIYIEGCETLEKCDAKYGNQQQNNPVSPDTYLAIDPYPFGDVSGRTVGLFGSEAQPILDGGNAVYAYIGNYEPNPEDPKGFYTANPETNSDGTERVQYFRDKIGGTQGGWLYPNEWLESEGGIPWSTDTENALDKRSFHRDYKLTFYPTKSQTLYNYLNFGGTYYRLQKQENGFFGVYAENCNTGNLNQEKYPYWVAKYDFSDFTAELKKSGHTDEETYVYWNGEGTPNSDYFFTIDPNVTQVSISTRLSGDSDEMYAASDHWLHGATPDDWGQRITDPATKTIHRDFKATLYSKSTRYIVKFLQGDQELQSGDVNCGSSPKYTGNVPVKSSSDGVSYKFYGWKNLNTGDIYSADEDLPAVLGTVSYEAVFKVVLTITARDASKTYDSTPLTNAGFTVTGYPADLAEADKPDFSVEMTDDSTITNVGNQPNVIATVNEISVSKDDAVLIGDYFVQTADGTLTVSPRKVTITAGDASQSYNGDPLTESSFDVDGLADEDTHTFTVDMTPGSTITEPGVTQNVIATVDGVPVSTGVETKVGNYLVTTVNGTLEVLLSELEVKVTAAPSTGVQVGDTIIYTVEVTNSGTAAVKDGTLESNLADLSGRTFALASGKTATFIYIYTVTQNDFDAGTIVDTVKANATAERGENPEEAQATATVTAAEATAELSITKEADTTSGVAVGDTITYTVKVKNTGNVTVTDGILADNLVDLSDKTFTLAPGSQTTFVYTYTVTQADVDAGEIENVVTANATASRGDDPDEVAATATVTAEEANAELSITKSANPTSGVVVGDTITYTVVVTNTGNVSVTDGTLRDTLVDLSGKTFKLAPGASAEFTYSYTVIQTDVDAGKINNTVTANATAVRGDDPTVVSADAEVTTVAAKPRLEPEYTYVLNGIDVGDTITFTVTVINTGNVTIIDIKISDQLVPLDEPLFDLAPGETKTFTYEYTLSQADINAGSVQSFFDASGWNPNGGISGFYYTEDISLTATASLEVTKTASPTSDVKVGDTITYTVNVKNTGNVSVEDGTLTDDLADLSDKTFALASGEEKTFTYTYTVTQDDVDAGKVVNTVKANATAARGDDPAEVTATAEVTTEAAVAELSVSKSADVTEDVKVGDTITYTVEVTNTGNVTVTDVTLSDTMVTVEENGFSLAPGKTKEISYKYTVTQADVDAGEIANTVTVSATAARGDDPDDASATVTVAAEAVAAELSITKSVNESANAVNAGDTITYTVVVKNTGNVTVKDITLSDTLVTLDETFDLAPAETKTVTYEYTVNNADVDAGIIENVVKANGTAARGDDPEEVSATVTVLPGREALIIESETKSWTYDGEIHTSEVYTVKYDGEEVQPDDETGKVFTLKTGDKLTITSNAAGVKDYDTEYLANNTFTYTIENETLYENVNTTFGTLSIDKRTVTLTSESDEKVYDGTALTKPDVTVEGDGFVDGEVTDLKANGTVTNVSDGQVVNTISYTESDSYKPANYTVTTTEGTLKITSKTVKITWGETSFAFDGKKHQPSAEVSGLPDGDSCNVTIEGEGTDCGKYTAKVTALSNKNYEISDDTASVDFEIYGCTVTFVDGDGKVLQSGVVPFGTIPSYEGETPSKTGTSQSVFTFDGTWSPEITAVSRKETTYIAQFTETKKEYYLAYQGYGGSEGTLPVTEIPVSELESGTTIMFGFKSNINDEETFDHLKEILINGKAAPSEGVNKYRGSVIIELQPKYLDSLEPGDYKLTAVFDDAEEQSIDAKFRVTAKAEEPEEPEEPEKPEEPEPSPTEEPKEPEPTPTVTPVKPDVPTPRTGDSMDMAVVAAILGFAVAVMILIFHKRREEEED